MEGEEVGFSVWFLFLLSKFSLRRGFFGGEGKGVPLFHMRCFITGFISCIL